MLINYKRSVEKLGLVHKTCGHAVNVVYASPIDLAAFQESYNQRQMKPPAENKLLCWHYYNTVTGGEYYNI